MDRWRDSINEIKNKNVVTATKTEKREKNRRKWEENQIVYIIGEYSPNFHILKNPR